MQNSTIYLLLIFNVVVIYAFIVLLLPEGHVQQLGLLAIAMILSLVAPYLIIERELDGRDKRLAEKESELVEVREELTDAHRKVQESATLDDLSGAYNSRHYEDLISGHCSIAARGEYLFSICTIQIDDFDKLVEKIGRVKSDAVLRLFVSVIKASLREVDMIARLEGDRFGLMFSGASEEFAMLAVNRMADLVRQISVSKDDPDLRLETSTGVVEFRESATVESMLADADQALASAIRKRDRVAAYIRSDTAS